MKQKLQRIIARLRRRARRTPDRYADLGTLCESPIEKLFWKVGYPRLSKIADFTPQTKAGPYRLDFSLVGDNFKIAVECDGYQYHSTEKQITADNSRDLDLMCQGWIVVRVTGSRIWRDAPGCVADVVRLVKAVKR